VAHYVLDKGASRFIVRAFAGGILSAMGHNPTIAIRDFSGEGTFDPDAPEQTSARVQIRADSLEVTDDIKNSDRKEMESTMKEKVLESSNYPTITFESTATSADGPSRVTLNGNLSLRGVTRSLPVTVQLNHNSDTVRANGEFTIKQTDYSIPRVSVAGGAMKLKDELKFAFDIVARKQE
jgi:polyisoprenoid-binding protein YceI